MTVALGPAGRSDVRSVRRALLRPPLALAAAAAVGTGVLAAWDPHVHHVPLCPIHAATGLWCPLCGGLRAVNDLASGHVATMLSDNVLLVVALPLVVGWWFAWLRRAVSGRPGGPTMTLSPRARRWVWWSVVAALVAYTVVRNLPAGSFLAPAA